MLKGFRALLFALIMSFSVSVYSQPVMTLGDLQQICSGKDQEAKTACKFYIMGYTQGISIPISRKPCMPENYSFFNLEITVKDKISNLVKMYPGDTKLEASGVLGGILISLYKCPNT